MGRVAAQANDPFSKAVVECVVEAIHASGMSQKSVFTAAEMSMDYFYKRTRGASPFNTNDIYRICEAISIDPAELMYEAAKKADAQMQSEMSTEDRAKLALERAQRAAEYGLAAMEGDKRSEDNWGA